MMLTKIKTTENPFGPDWLDKLRQVLSTIDRLNISDSRLLIDGNRRALFIIGHKTKNSKAYFGLTKIYPDGADLKIQATALKPHLFIGIVFPIVAIIIFLMTSKSILFSMIGTFLFIWNPIYYIRDIVKQDKFGDEIKKDIDRLNKQL